MRQLKLTVFWRCQRSWQVNAWEEIHDSVYRNGFWKVGGTAYGEGGIPVFLHTRWLRLLFGLTDEQIRDDMLAIYLIRTDEEPATCPQYAQGMFRSQFIPHALHYGRGRDEATKDAAAHYLDNLYHEANAPIEKWLRCAENALRYLLERDRAAMRKAREEAKDE